MTRAIVIAAALLVATPAWADGLAEQEQRHERLQAHRLRLEQQLTEQSQRIQRLKRQPRGVGRDYQLRTALRTNLSLAGRLTRLRAEVRSATEALAEAYKRAIAATTDKTRKEELRRRAHQLERRRGASRIVTSERVSRYDSPDDLEEKADLLADSEEKVRAQLRRLERRLARMQQRARLQRHSQAADDSPFVESAPRRISRTRATTTADRATVPAAAGDTKSSGTTGPTGARDDAPNPPAPAQPPSADSDSDGFEANTGGGLANQGAGEPDPGAGAAPGTLTPATPIAPSVPSSGVAVTIRDVMDPGLLLKLERAGTTGDMRSRIVALKRASERLEQLAKGLAHKSKALRQRAKALRTKK